MVSPEKLPLSPKNSPPKKGDPPGKGRLLLVDAGSILHPAYHVLKGFATSRGFPTGAVFGFTRTLLKLLREYPSEYLAVAFDAPGKTRRHKRYEEYKAHRPKMADDFAVQIPYVKAIVEALGIPQFEEPGYEADDLLAALAREARLQGWEVLIVTGDKDLLQLVGRGVVVLKPKREMRGDVEALDAEGVRRYLGVPPERVRDYLALVGDPTDNVPGVPGVGEKTARRLLEQFGSLPEVLKNADTVSPKRVREALRQYQGLAELSYELVKLEEVPLPEDALERCRPQAPDWDRVRELFEELEFRSLLKELGLEREGEGRPAVGPEISVEVVQTEQQLEALLRRLAQAEEISLDLEASGEDELTAEIVGIALAFEPGRGVYIPFKHDLTLKHGVKPDEQPPRQLASEEVLPQLKPHLERLRIVGQNLKYDYKLLRRQGVRIENIAFDSMLAGYLLDPEGRKDLNELALRYLGHGVRKFKDLGVDSLGEVPIAEAARYAAEDAEVVLRLQEAMLPKLREEGLERLLHEVELPLIPVLAHMELNGIRLDPQVLEEQAKELEVYLEQLKHELFRLAGGAFNPNSPKQVAHVLFDVLKLPVLKRTKTGPSTDASVLEQLAAQEKHPFPEKLLTYRELEKLLNTYVRKLPEHIHPVTGRIHTSFNQSVTATGRLSSSSPNLQNIPVRGIGARIRRAFVAPPGRVLIGADYSQIELRILAHITEDRGLIEAFQREEDIHARTAATIFQVPLEEVTPEQRDVAKRINFGIAYGMSAYGLAQWAKISRHEANEFIKSYFQSFPGVKAYMERIVREAEEKGFVESLLGRRRYFTGRLDSRMKREAINMPIQASAADLMKLAMIRVYERIERGDLPAQMLLQIHDELIFEADEADAEECVPRIRETMESVLELKVPLRVDLKVGPNWGEI